MSDAGDRDSKLLYAKTKIGKQTVPRNEIASMNLGLQVVANMIKIYKTVSSVFVFGDSEAVNLQINTVYKPKDVFRSNKCNNIQANIEEMRDAGVLVEIFLVRSAHMGRLIQHHRAPSTTPTTAASVSGRSLGQRRQGRNISVLLVRVDTPPTLTLESSSSYLTLPFINFLPHPTTLAPSMLVI